MIQPRSYQLPICVGLAQARPNYAKISFAVMPDIAFIAIIQLIGQGSEHTQIGLQLLLLLLPAGFLVSPWADSTCYYDH